MIAPKIALLVETKSGEKTVRSCGLHIDIATDEIVETKLKAGTCLRTHCIRRASARRQS